eukprot:TRINITY_DN2220_c0_g2_i4.p1 TRINITY_DN2220_c0_g2~~TRINITY_DN2220_c0_g2_i4.p1  ORF type:complete len:324 (+),score=46.33 TRINITY_DN2220_c0_g2_i4:48-1019(+)
MEKYEEVEEGLFVSEGFASSGERVFFALEQLTNVSRRLFSQLSRNYFRYFTRECTKSRGSILSALSSPRVGYPIYDDSVAKNYGFSKLEYETFTEGLKKRDFKNKAGRAIRDIGSGLTGFECEIHGADYVAYVSKNPVLSKFPFMDNMCQVITYKQYLECFGFLLIIVTTNLHSDQPFFQNHGIVRNPSSFLEGGYKRLSIKLHTFTANVVHALYPIKQYLIITPTEIMEKIATEEMREGELFVGTNMSLPGATYDKFPPKIHVNGSTIKICKNNLDLMKFKNRDPPDEEVEYILLTLKGHSNGNGEILLMDIKKMTEFAFNS